MPHKDPEARRAYLAARKEHNRLVHRRWATAHCEERTAYMAARRAKNPEEAAAKNLAYRLANKDALAVKAKARREAHLEERRQKEREHARARRAADPEAARAKDRARRAGDPEKAHEQDHARRNGNREKMNAQERARRAANPEPRRAQDRARLQTPSRKAQAQTAKGRRRALKQNAPLNDLSSTQWQEIQAAYDHRCAYCGKRRKGHLTQDHITPLSKGGSHTLANVIPACSLCNSKKGTKPVPVPVQPLLLTIAPSKKKKAA